MAHGLVTLEPLVESSSRFLPFDERECLDILLQLLLALHAGLVDPCPPLVYRAWCSSQGVPANAGVALHAPGLSVHRLMAAVDSSGLYPIFGLRAGSRRAQSLKRSASRHTHSGEESAIKCLITLQG